MGPTIHAVSEQVAVNGALITRLRELLSGIAPAASEEVARRGDDAALARCRAELEAAHREVARCTELLVFCHRIVEELPCPIVITTRHGLIGNASEAVATALNVSTAFLRGKPLIGFVARSDCQAFRRLLRGTEDGVDAAPLRFRARRGGGVFSANAQVRRSAMGIVLWSLRLDGDGAP
jgi:PAS domain-containing protein